MPDVQVPGNGSSSNIVPVIIIRGHLIKLSQLDDIYPLGNLHLSSPAKKMILVRNNICMINKHFVIISATSSHYASTRFIFKARLHVVSMSPFLWAAPLIFTGRNEVVAKVIFLHLSLILFTGGGGVSASVHAGIPTPGSRHPPQD